MNFKKVSTKILSVLMAAMMLFSVCAPVIAGATELDAHDHDGATSTQYDPYDTNKDGKVTYVSLGDSMTNGYGLNGYYPGDQEGVYESAGRLEDGYTGKDSNCYGYMVNANAAWPTLLAKEMGWELYNLSISGMRPAELRYLLDKGYIGDHYTWAQFIDEYAIYYDDEGTWFDGNTPYAEGSSKHIWEMYNKIGAAHIEASKVYGAQEISEGWKDDWTGSRFARAYFGRDNRKNFGIDEAGINARIAEIARIWNEHAGYD